MKHRKIVLAIIATLIIVPVVILGLVFSLVSSEGYPTSEAVRNYLIRDGKVEVFLPSGIEATSVECSNLEATVFNYGSKVEVKIGYSESTIKIQCKKVSDGQPVNYSFKQMKYNNWNRIRYIPKDDDDAHGGFDYYENGVKSKPKII
jgi:hypothetical protein